MPSTLSVGDAAFVEGNAGSHYAAVSVSLDAANNKSVSVSYTTADGTAKAGSDYTAASGTLAFAPGETSKTILAAVIGDRLPEPDESFIVKLSGARNAQIADGQGVVTIVDDEPRITISGVASYKADSGTTPFTFTVSLSAAYDQEVTVNYATSDGTAVAGVDYLAISGTLTFAPGETTKTITVEVVGDAPAGGGNKSILVSLGGASPNAFVIGGLSEGIILDDDYDNSDTTNYWGSYQDFPGTNLGQARRDVVS